MFFVRSNICGSLIVRSRFQAVQANEAACHRAAYYAAKNQSKGRACHCQFHYAGYILHIGKPFRVGGSGAVASRQRYRTAQKPNQWMQVHPYSGKQAKTVLHDQVKKAGPTE